METRVETNVQQQTPSLLGIFTSPSEQFERIRTNPKIWIPLLIVAVVNAVGMAMMAMMMDTDTLIKQGIPAENAEMFLTGTRIAMVVTGVLSPGIGAVVSSAIQLLIAKIAKVGVSFRQLFSMNTYITIVTAVGLLLNNAVAMAIRANPETPVTSLGGLLGKDQAGVLGSIEFFAIWAMILTATGLHKTARFSKALAWTITIIFFLIGLGIAMVGTLLQGAPKL
ncbi:YIP1 family protein [Neobacillus notoginsengisoli]|uniref:YIP1 family protein n=1 Tax=Neobacillus notoginsengisoli TaxID=1578198 RepID=A0A417YW91_9BACI|nr:Yip1 family protein [Neobacillus notoginsengisoli]RHW41521.1 YIP1 family protein [Neobacillus notoginsengisoli]